MQKGINTPVKPSRSGGSEIIAGTSQAGKILALALAPGDDNNPFQSLGMRETEIFQNDSPSAIAGFRLEIERILKKFKGRIELKPNTSIQITRDPEKGLGANFEWIDLTTNTTGEFKEFFKQPGS